MICFSHNELRDYLLQQLPTDVQARIEEHVATCTHCCRALDALTSDDLVHAFKEAAQRAAASRETHMVSPNVPNEVTPEKFSDWHPLEAAHQRLPLQFGRFVLREVLGAGGFAVVYRADDVNLKREVAVKIPHLGGLSDVVRNRFLHEGAAAAHMHHPHIVPVYQSGVHGGVCFLVSEYCPGQTLRQWLDTRRGRVSTRDSALLLSQLADAVEHAHQNGIVHRDIKPENVILDERRAQDGLPFCPKLTDFGTAKFMEAEQSLTRSGTLIGTVPYMAPEQITGNAVGPACDIYALGVVLFELLTGHLPTSGSDRAKMMQHVLERDAPLAHRLCREVPRDASAICAKCLERKPEKRYKAAGDLANDLRRFLNNEPTQARTLGMAVRLFRWGRRNPLPLTIMAAVCLIFTLILGGLGWHTRRLSRLNEKLVVANRHALDMKERAEQSELRTRRLNYASDIRLAANYWRDGDPKTVRDILRGCEPEQGETDLRGLEWHFLKRAVEPKPNILSDVAAPLYCLRFSADGRFFATGGQDGLIRIYDRELGELQRTINSGQREVNGVSFAPDGRTLASAGDDGSVCVWRRADGARLSRFEAHSGMAFAVEITPGGDQLASGGTDGLVHLWRDGDCVKTFRDHVAQVEAITVSADGRCLASVGKDRTLAVRHIETGDLHFKWSGAAGKLSSVAFSPDSKHLAVAEAAGETTSLVLFDIQAKRLVCHRRHCGGICSVAFSSSGDRIVTTDSAGVARIWGLSRDEGGQHLIGTEPLVSWQAHERRAYAGVFEPGDASVLTVGSGGQIRRYHYADLLNEVVVDADRIAEQFGFEETPGIHEIAFRGETYEVLATAHFGVALLDFEGEAPPSWLRFDSENLWSCLATPQNAHWFATAGSTPLTATAEGRSLKAVVERREILTGQTRRLWESNSNCSINHLACSPGGELVAVVVNDHTVNDQPKQLLLLDGESGELVMQLPAATGSKPQFSADGRSLVYGVQRELIAVDLRTRQQRVVAEAHADSQCGLAISADGCWLATCDEGRVVKIWSLGTLQLHAVLQGHQSQVTMLAFSADSRTLLSSSYDGTVKAWSVASGQPLMDLHLGTVGVSHMALSADGQRLAVVEDKTRVRVVRMDE